MAKKERGGTHEQHVKAGQQSHKSVGIQSSSNSTGEGRGWHGDSKEHAEVGRKGGEAVSQDREHMAEIGRKGGEAVSQDREHMSEIGQKGGGAHGQGSRKQQSGSRGGTHEQHVKAGQQSHKNK